MSLNSLREIYLYGNFNVIYNNTMIRDIDLDTLLDFSNKVSKSDLTEGWCWRFYNNFQFFINCYENYILIDFKKFKKLISLLNNVIINYENLLKINTFNIKIESNLDKDVFIIVTTLLLNNIYDKLNIYYSQNIEIDKEKYYKDFERYLSNIKEKTFFCDFTTPYDNLKWTSKWKLVYENMEIYKESIDIYLDSYTRNKNFYYSNSMKRDISSLAKRIKFLKSNAEFYYNAIIKHINKISEKFFEIFPYKILMEDYKELILCDKEVYIPKMMMNKDISKLSKEFLMFSILPGFLSSYILGFPVISIDIPNNNILKKYIEKLDLLGPDGYFNFISKNFNKKKLDSISFEVESGNAIDDNEYIDLCYNKIIDYNQDDVVSLLNNNVIHYFSCKEFKTILKKRENPYNRQEFNIFYHILENLKFKNKSKKIFLNKGLSLELNGTLKENFEELKENIFVNKINSNFSDESVNNELDMFYQPFINMLFSGDRFILQN